MILKALLKTNKVKDNSHKQTYKQQGSMADNTTPCSCKVLPILPIKTSDIVPDWDYGIIIIAPNGHNNKEGKTKCSLRYPAQAKIEGF